MDPLLVDRIYTFLAGREGKRNKTLYFMMQMYERMDALGFDYAKFQSGEEAAQDEGDRFLVFLRKRKEEQIAQALRDGRAVHAKRRGSGIPNYVKNLKALARMQRYKEADWKITRQAPSQRDVYLLRELRALIRLPFRRTEERRLQRALIAAHLALGWRLDEHSGLEDTHIDAEGHRVFLANPEKGNPQRWLPIEAELFSTSRAFMSWSKHRPVLASNPRLVWTYTDCNGVVRACGPQKIAKLLSDAGKLVGVRANCVRGRHTRCAALLAQGKQLAFVMFFMGHKALSTLAAYLEMISAGLLEHLRRSSWFVSPPDNNKET